MKNSYNSEVIRARALSLFNGKYRSYIDLELFPNGYNGDGEIGSLQKVVDDYEMDNGKIPVLGYDANGAPIINPLSGYNPQDPYVNRDPRFYATILYDGAPFQGRKVETFLPGGKDTKDGAHAQ